MFRAYFQKDNIRNIYQPLKRSGGQSSNAEHTYTTHTGVQSAVESASHRGIHTLKLGIVKFGRCRRLRCSRFRRPRRRCVGTVAIRVLPHCEPAWAFRIRSPGQQPRILSFCFLCSPPPPSPSPIRRAKPSPIVASRLPRSFRQCFPSIVAKLLPRPTKPNPFCRASPSHSLFLSFLFLSLHQSIRSSFSTLLVVSSFSIPHTTLYVSSPLPLPRSFRLCSIQIVWSFPSLLPNRES